MGLPQILIEFKKRAATAVARSQNGTVAVILFDSTKTGTAAASYKYAYEADISSDDWTAANLDYLNKIFKGAPKKVLIERAEEISNLEDALARLKNKKWNWLTVPGIAEGAVKTVGDWIIAQRAANKTFKAVLPDTDGYTMNNEGLVCFATNSIVAGTKTYTAAEYSGRIAGVLAGLAMTESATYKVLAEVESIEESTAPDDDIDAGKMILINDGENIKIGRGINSLHILDSEQTEDEKKIKIIEGKDLIRDDIRETFEDNYIGINNSYDNKVTFISAVNQYFTELVREGVLYDEYDNTAEIDVDATRSYLVENGYDVTEMSDSDIAKARTGEWVFALAAVQFADAMESLKLKISME